MQDLRLVGISENGEHVLLTDGAGGRYSLALNDDLKRVVRRDKTQTLGATAQTNPQAPLRPRDVQALIRAGVPLEEIAERARWSVDKVLRYESPIRAERDYVGELAQSVILDSREDPITLRERAAKRLADRGVEAERVVWDSWKSDEDHWSVVVRFPAGGRLREATWHFDPSSRSLRAVDDKARWLGGDENTRAPKSVTDEAPARPTPVHTRDEPVFDVEAEGWEEEASQVPAREGSEHREELTTAMRQRHANRRGKGSVRSADPANITGLSSATPTKAHDDAEKGGVEKLDLTGEAPPLGSHPRPSEFLTVVEGGEETTRDRGTATQHESSGHETVVNTASEGDSSPAETASSSAAAESGRDRRRSQRRSRAQVRNTPKPESEPDLDDRDEGTVEESLGSDSASNPKKVDLMDGSLDDQTPESPTPKSDDTSAPVDEERAEQETPDSGSAEVPTRPAQSRKGGRPSVPSWDDIMFGGRSKR